MSYFMAKMHQIQFRLGLCGSVVGAYSTPPDPLAGFKGAYIREGKGSEGMGREEKEGFFLYI